MTTLTTQFKKKKSISIFEGQYTALTNPLFFFHIVLVVVRMLNLVE